MRKKLTFYQEDSARIKSQFVKNMQFFIGKHDSSGQYIPYLGSK